MTVINALVFCRLFYCSSVWGGISMKNVLKLQSVQNFATRIITSTRKYDHIHPILRDLNWLNLESTIKYRNGIMAFKCMNGYAPEYLCEQFILQSKIHSRNKCNRDKLVDNLNNLNSFKRLYKLSLLEQQS